MLTKSDLQAIGRIVDERLDARLKNYPTKDYLDNRLKSALRGIAHKKDLRAMENRIIKKINLVSDHADSRLVDLEKRTNRIETHLQLPPLDNL